MIFSPSAHGSAQSGSRLSSITRTGPATLASCASASPGLALNMACRAFIRPGSLSLASIRASSAVQSAALTGYARARYFFQFGTLPRTMTCASWK